MLAGNKRHLAFVKNMRNSVGEFEDKKDKAITDAAKNEDYDALRKELERMFDELFGPIDDEDD